MAAVIRAQRDHTRILAVIDDLEVGGAQQHLLSLAQGLTPYGYEMVVATSGREPLATAYHDAGIPVLSLAHRSIKHRVSPTFVARLTRLVRGESFELIHAHLHSASVSAAVAARASHLPLVLTQHSMNTWQSEFHRALQTWSHRQAGAIVAVSHPIAAVVEHSGVRVEVIPNVAPPSAPRWSQQERTAVRRHLGVPVDAYVVSYVGRLTADKNPLLFAETAATIAVRCPAAHFLVVGDGPLRPDLERLIRARGLERRFTCTGFLPDAAVLHQAADVLVLTSKSEACPLVVLEAMSHGRPVVATAVGDVPRQVLDGVTGFLAGSESAAGLARGVIALADPLLRERLGGAARRHVGEHFPLDGMLTQTAAIYRRLAERTGAAHAGLSRNRAPLCRYRS